MYVLSARPSPWKRVRRPSRSSWWKMKRGEMLAAGPTLTRAWRTGPTVSMTSSMGTVSKNLRVYGLWWTVKTFAPRTTSSAPDPSTSSSRASFAAIGRVFTWKPW